MNVLFRCVANSARSQMAEVWHGAGGGNRVDHFRDFSVGVREKRL
jgi:protein-tyrosine-phosphatase